MEEYIGTVQAFAFGFTPRDWLPCNGQLLAISQYQTLFSLLGTTYGGDGRTTFGLPDLRGRTPVNQGTGTGLSNHKLGTKGGSETNTLNITQMPTHSHNIDFSGQSINAGVSIPAVNDDGTTDESEGNILANNAGAYAASSSADTALSAFNAPLSGSMQTGNTGVGAPINNMQPFLALNYCICINGIYPPRT